MAKKKNTQKRSGKRRGRPRGSTKLSSISASDLRTELQRRQSDTKRLKIRRDELVSELEEIDRELEVLDNVPGGGSSTPSGNGRRRSKKKKTTRQKTGRRGGRRAKNKVSLVNTLRQVLSNQTMSVTDAADAVQRAGYKTKSSSFRTIVNQALLSNPDAFKKVARGQYTAK